MADSVRIDKYVWAIRLYKTRSDATEACNGNKVQINGIPAKPSKAVKVGDTISVRKGVALYTFKVLQIAEQRTPVGSRTICRPLQNTSSSCSPA